MSSSCTHTGVQTLSIQAHTAVHGLLGHIQHSPGSRVALSHTHCTSRSGLGPSNPLPTGMRQLFGLPRVPAPCSSRSGVRGGANPPETALMFFFFFGNKSQLAPHHANTASACYTDNIACPSNPNALHPGTTTLNRAMHPARRPTRSRRSRQTATALLPLTAASGERRARGRGASRAEKSTPYAAGEYSSSLVAPPSWYVLNACDGPMPHVWIRDTCSAVHAFGMRDPRGKMHTAGRSHRLQS